MKTHKSNKSKDKNQNIDEDGKEKTNIEQLKKALTLIIPYFSSINYDIIFPIFGKRESEFINLINNVANNKKSDSLICYGNNNQVLKVILDKAMMGSNKIETECVKVILNGYFDTNEETLLKELCNKLEIKSMAGYDNYKKALDDYFLNSTQDNKVIVIYCDYIDHLVFKKKQRLLYTLFDLINNSTNIMLIGFTYNYNLMDQMEKRIRSRFSQKTIYINIEKKEEVINAIEKMFTANPNITTDEKLKKCLEHFYNALINENNEEFIFYLEKMVKLGTSIDGILNKIKNFLALSKLEIDNYQKVKDEEDIDKNSLIKILSKLTKNITLSERQGHFYNMLLNFSKLHLSLFISLCLCVNDSRGNILLQNIYVKYKTIFSASFKRNKYDLILIQKFLEELNNSNLITITNDEKYGKLYHLKLPLSEIGNIFRELDKQGKLDTEMKKLINSIKK